MSYCRILLFSTLVIILVACNEGHHSAVIKPGKVVQVDSLPGACPNLTKDSKGRIIMNWAKSINDSTSVFCYAMSEDGGKSFGKEIIIPSSGNLQPHSENLPKIIFKPSGEIIALWGAANPNPNNKYSGLVFYNQLISLTDFPD